jgi:tRNA(fMet)-specific endonuclease VapC
LTSGSAPVLLDTGIVIHLSRGGTAATRIEERFALGRQLSTTWISVVSVGEAMAIATRNEWGATKQAALGALLGNLVVVDISRPPILRQYAELSAELHRTGRRMGQQNDLWIAATAAATGALLLTTDRDFDGLHPGTLRREWVDPESLR